MKFEIIGVNFTNIDTGEVLVHHVKDYDFSVKVHRESLHNLLDAYIDMCISHNCHPKHDTFCFELRSYREHMDFLLPF